MTSQDLHIGTVLTFLGTAHEKKKNDTSDMYDYSWLQVVIKFVFINYVSCTPQKMKKPYTC